MSNQNGHPNKRTEQCKILIGFQENIALDWQRISSVGQHDRTRLGQIAKGFIELVETQYKKEHSPLYYANRLRITKRYLRIACQQSVGFSPTYCIQSRLMMEACSLLKVTDVSIKEVAFGLGFEYPSHFSKFFKAYSGLAPKECRGLS